MDLNNKKCFGSNFNISYNNDCFNDCTTVLSTHVQPSIARLVGLPTSVEGEVFPPITHAESGLESFPGIETSIPGVDFLRERLDTVMVTETFSEIEEFMSLIFKQVSIDVVDTTLHVITLTYKLTRAKSYHDMFLAAFDFLRGCFPLREMKNLLHNAYLFLKERMIALYTAVSRVTSESGLIDILQNLRKGYSKYANSEVAYSLRDFILSLVSLKLFSFDKAKKITKFFGTSPPSSGVDIIELILSSTTDLLVIGSRMVAGEHISSIIASSDPIAGFAEEVIRLEYQQHFTYPGIPVPGKICRREFHKQVRKAIEVGDHLYVNQPKLSPHSKPLLAGLNKIKAIDLELNSIMNGATRPVPYAVIVCGQPGIGKSTLLNLICKLHSSMKGREYDQSHKYTRTKNSEYWEMYDPLSHAYVHYSELGSEHKDIAKTQGSTMLNEVLSLIDNQPYPCNMADLRMKGKILASPEMVISDCNNPEMNVRVTNNAPSAVFRRFLYIHAYVKQEFCVSGGVSLDPLKSLASDSRSMDRWCFDVYRMIPTSNTACYKEYKIPEGSGIDAFVDFLLQDMREFTARQQTTVGIQQDINLADYGTVQTENAEIDTSIVEAESGANPNEPEDVDPLWLRIQLQRDRERRQRELDFLRNPPQIRVDPQHYYRLHKEEMTSKVQRLVDFGTSICNFVASIGRTHSQREIIWNIAQCIIMIPYLVTLISMLGFFSIEFALTPFPTSEYGRNAAAWSQKYREWCLIFSSLGNTPDRVDILYYNCYHFFWPIRLLVWLLIIIGTAITRFFLGPRNGVTAEVGVHNRFGAYELWMFHYLTFRYHMIVGLNVSKDIGYYGSKFLWTLCCLIACGVILILIFIIPNPFFLKVTALKDFTQKFGYHQTVLEHRWRLLKLCFGVVSEDFVWKPEPSYDAYKYMFVVASLLVCYKAYSKIASINAEGGVASTSKEYTPEETLSFIQAREEKVGAERPIKVRKHHNGVDWDAPRPKPMIVPVQQLDDPIQIRAKCMHNVRYCYYMEGDVRKFIHIFGVMGNFALMSKHFLPKRDVVLRVCIDPDLRLGMIDVKIKFGGAVQEYVEVEDDLVLINLRTVKFANILKYFPTEFVVLPPKRASEAYIGSEQVHAIEAGDLTVEHSPVGPYVIHNVFKYLWTGHGPGKCGLPLFLQTGNTTCIAGLHTAGSDAGYGYSQKVRARVLNDAISRLIDLSPMLPVYSEGAIRLPNGCTGLGAIPERSVFRFEDTPATFVLGGIEGYQVPRPSRSELKGTFFIGKWRETVGVSPFTDTGVPKLGAPAMTGAWCLDGVWRGPLNNVVRKLGKIRKSLDVNLMKQVTDCLTKRIVTGLKAKGVQRLHPVPYEVAVNGDPDNFYCRAMTMSTSCGFTFPGKKGKWMDSVELSFKKDSKLPKPELREQVVEILRAYENCEDAMPLIGTQLKDEPRSYQKILSKETRAFYMGPVDHLIVCRMFLMSFYACMVEHGEVFCSAIGINMQSSDVDKFMERLYNFTSHFMEGDLRGFDTDMPSDIGLASNTVTYNVHKEMEYGDDALVYLQGILSDELAPTVVTEGVVSITPGHIVSGKYGTAENNTLRNLIMLLYFWAWSIIDRPEYTMDDFWIKVLPALFGDDNLTGVKEEISEWFNNVTYKAFVKEHYGMDFTNSKKTDEIEPFVDALSVSFLKRTFHFNEHLQHTVALLEPDSLMKTVCYCLPSRTATFQEQMLDSSQSVLREFFFRDSPNEFELRRRRFANVLSEKFGIPFIDVLNYFPTYDQIKNQVYNQNPSALTDALDVTTGEKIKRFLISDEVVGEVDVQEQLPPTRHTPGDRE